MSRRTRYYAYLDSSDWQRKRALAFAAYGRICNRCHRRKEPLQVHHKRYRKDWNAATVDDLEVLCRKCHQAHHREAKKLRRLNRRSRRPLPPNKLPSPRQSIDALFMIGSHRA